MAQDLRKVLEQSWEHYKLNKIDPVTNRPLGDPDILGFGESGSQYFMTFSETVSYVMFRSVWMNDQATFNRVWEWAYYNLWRKNIDEIFYWQISQWGEMPQVRKDNLFAWRYVDNIKKKGRGGVIFFKWSDVEGALWRDGLDAAPDGDELIAASLALAHCLWGSQKGINDYLTHAKTITADIWNKCVKYIIPGVIDNFSSRPHLKSWFIYTTPSALLTRTLTAGPEKNTHAMEVNYFIPNTKWGGVGKELEKADFSEMHGLSFSCRGKQGDKLKVIFKGFQKSNPNRETEATTEVILTNDWQHHVLPFDKFKAEDKIDWTRIDALFLQADDNNQKGYFVITDIKIYDGKLIGKENFHLTSNDKGEPWINLSYYMPFIYNTIFKKLDPSHPWEELAKNCYEDITTGANATLRDEDGKPHKGNGQLIPDWFSLTTTGKPTNVPWTNNLSTDDYMHGWDAFRFDFFAALDLAWNNEPLAKKYLMETGPYEFYKNELIKTGKINRGYAIDGKTMKGLRGTDEDGPGPYGCYLSLFKAAGDQQNANKIMDNMMKTYNEQGYWGKNQLEYYEQNWAWLGLAFSLDQGLHLKEALKKLDQ
ncbi:MAG: glycosyl hydrolase family 8 [Candidatus Margulisiibacteriota bacterium]|jgi:endo-1,4-beta-D-glucanase Y